MITTIRLQALHTKSGNPRRVYVTLKDGYPIASYDEGYKGEDAITDKAHRESYSGYTVDVTVTEYNYTVKGEFRY